MYTRVKESLFSKNTVYNQSADQETSLHESLSCRTHTSIHLCPHEPCAALVPQRALNTASCYIRQQRC